jgi:hypothetical protein
MWARTGNPVYWHRGVRIAVGYRRGYVEQYNGATPHWTQALGLLRHYQLTGDDASRAALQLIWDKAGWWSVPEHLGAAKSTDVENRIRARMLQLQHVLWQLADTHAERARLAATLDASLAVVLGEQAADGRWPVQAAGNQPMPYMDGMLCDALIDLHDGYRADPRLVTVVRRTADDLWRRFRPCRRRDAVPGARGSARRRDRGGAGAQRALRQRAVVEPRPRRRGPCTATAPTPSSSAP